MPIAVDCPTCGKRLKAPEEAAGKVVSCPKCSARMMLPALEPISPEPSRETAVAPEERDYEPPRASRRNRGDLEEDDYEDDEPESVKTPTKYCHECGRKIRARAEICPKCGVRQHGDTDDWPRQYGISRDGIKIPLLISAISNILVGMLWAATCFGIAFTIPMIILCIFEFALWSKADRLTLRRLGRQAKTLAIFEIVVGLFNTPTLICGIVILINSGKMSSRG